MAPTPPTKSSFNCRDRELTENQNERQVPYSADRPPLFLSRLIDFSAMPTSRFRTPANKVQNLDITV